MLDDLRADRRGRLTVPDVIFLLASVAFLGALYPVFWSGFRANINLLSPGTAYLFQLILPLAIIVLLSVVYVKAAGGA